MNFLINTNLRKKLFGYAFTHVDEEYYVRGLANIIDEERMSIIIWMYEKLMSITNDTQMNITNHECMKIKIHKKTTKDGKHIKKYEHQQ